MARRRPSARLVAGSILAGLVTGCAGSVAPNSTPISPTAAPTTTPAPSSSVSSLPPGLSSLDGTATFAFVAFDERTWTTRCSPGRGVIRVADGRVAGEYVNLICLEEDDEVAADDVWDFWGRHLIWNDGGTWDGQFVGTRDEAGNHVVDMTSAGSGDYAGLRLTTHEVAGPDDSTWEISNAIVPGRRPDPISVPPERDGMGDPQINGTRSCGNVIVEPSETRAGDTIRRRGEVDICTWDVSDARFAGPDFTIINADLRDDGSMVGWGSVTTRFGVGPYALERAADGTATVRTFLTGAGRYEGLVYWDVQAGKGETWSVTGWIAPVE